jgi:hypothetical protein
MLDYLGHRCFLPETTPFTFVFGPSTNGHSLDDHGKLWHAISVNPANFGWTKSA